MKEHLNSNLPADDAEVITFLDENDEEINLEILDRRELRGRTCVLTTQIFDSEAEASQYDRAETIFFFWEYPEDENGEQTYDALEEEDELDAAVTLFQDTLMTYLGEN